MSSVPAPVEAKGSDSSSATSRMANRMTPAQEYRRGLRVMTEQLTELLKLASNDSGNTSDDKPPGVRIGDICSNGWASNRNPKKLFMYLGVSALCFRGVTIDGKDAGPMRRGKKAKVAKRKKPTPPVDDGANKARAEECRVKLEELRGLSVLYQLQWKSGHVIPKALVGPTFYSLPIDGKQAFADTINCYLLQGAPEYIEIEMLDWRTGKRVARYSWGKLKME